MQNGVVSDVALEKAARECKPLDLRWLKVAEMLAT
jgi:hypothetical protein